MTAWHALTPDAQAWIRAEVARLGLDFEAVSEAMAVAVLYGAGQSDRLRQITRAETSRTPPSSWRPGEGAC